MSNVFALASSLARPVARELMSLDHAEVAVAVACARAAREGALAGNADLADAIRISTDILHRALINQDTALIHVRAAIDRVIWPMITKRVLIGRIRAEAHNLNADRGGLMTEAQVEDVIVDALYRAEARERATMAPSRLVGRGAHG